MRKSTDRDEDVIKSAVLLAISLSIFTILLGIFIAMKLLGI